MGRMPVAERREQLIAAALAVASASGIEAATVRAVAAEAGVSLGVVHYCFEDKDELLRAVAEEITARNASRALGALPEGLDLLTTLTLAVESLWDGLTSNRGEQLLSYEVTLGSLRSQDHGRVAAAQYRHSRLAARKYLEHAAEVGGIHWLTPIDSLARSVVAAVDGYSLAWLVDGDGVAAREGLRAFGQYLVSQAERLSALDSAAGLQPLAPPPDEIA